MEDSHVYKPLLKRRKKGKKIKIKIYVGCPNTVEATLWMPSALGIKREMVIRLGGGYGGLLNGGW